MKRVKRRASSRVAGSANSAASRSVDCVIAPPSVLGGVSVMSVVAESAPEEVGDPERGQGEGVPVGRGGPDVPVEDVPSGGASSTV